MGESCFDFKYRPALSLQWDSNPQPLSLKRNTQPLSQTSQMIELCCEYLSVRCIKFHTQKFL